MTDQPTTQPSPAADRGRLRWHFAGAVLDERTRELVIEGVEVELERKPLEVLVYLLQHAGEVCTKDELLATVWPGRVLSETVLTKCIGRLREVLHDGDQQVIRTAYGFGYRFTAQVRIESMPAPKPIHFDFRPGAHPPNRALWSLIERLGTGGHGEAWRGRHDKTYEQRVFKFALDESSLGALKREITLFRIINDTLGANARVVKLLDWNLEQPPYFIEAEYITGGSLADWARAQGVLASVPLTDRLEIVAKIADALAGVHGVGVLHKDLKPSNILVRTYPGHPIDIVLADFGSGAVLDLAELERLGITRLGFTKTLSAADSTSGTPMYVAPEIVAGQPFTVKADIYALGVILYQFLVGDFTKIMSPGWERDIDDELLREDVALLAEGDAAVRLGDAEQVARRLRSLPERHEQLTAKRQAKTRAEQATRMLERARARRTALAFAFATLLIGLVTSTVLFLRAREANRNSELAAAHSKAVTEFLSRDVFAPVSSGKESVKNLRVAELLTRAGDQIDARFATQPEVASELHFVIGRSLDEFYETGAAVAHFNRALELGRSLQGTGSESALRSAAELIYFDYVLGRLRNNIAGYQGSLAAGAKSLDPHNRVLLNLREQLARGRFLLGDWKQAAAQLQGILADLNAAGLHDPILIGHANLYLGQVQTALAQADAAHTHLRYAVKELSDALGEANAEVSEARDALGRALIYIGQYAESTEQLDQAEELAVRWEPQVSWTVVRPRFYKGLLYIEMGAPGKARPLLAEIVDFQDAHIGEHPELDHTATVRQALAETYLLDGQSQKAIDILRTAQRVSELADGATHPNTRSIRLSLAEAMLASGADTTSRQAIAALIADDLTDLPVVHPFVAQLQRVRGLLALQQGDRPLAKQLLRQALVTYEALYGPRHWRTVRVSEELLRASS